jgi:hypothetical protein
MANNPFVTPEDLAKSDFKALVDRSPKIASAARWFWWIAGLSAVNTLLMNLGSNTSFVIGLSITIMADAFFHAFRPAAFVIDAVAVGFFYAMGYFALRGHRWAFIVGAAVYAVDASIYIYFEDIMPIAFHVWALFCIIGGFIALNKAIKSLELTTTEELNQCLVPTPAAVTSSSAPDPRQP